MSTPAYTGPVLRRGLLVTKRIPIADIAASTLEEELVAAPQAGYAAAVTRFMARLYAAGAACSGAGANDNLVVRSTDKDGAIVSQAILGDVFLETAPTAYAMRAAGPADNQVLAAGEPLVLAYAASADGITTTSATGYLDVTVEYDLVFVGQ